MLEHAPDFAVRMAASAEDIQAAQRLRYQVFVQELGADGPQVDHKAAIERDQFDPFAHHLLLEDLHADAPTRLVGVYRLLTCAGAAQAGGFYSETEFDLTALKQSDRSLLELGRSCLHPSYRGGAGMLHLWAGLASFVSAQQIDVLFGVASFHGTDLDALAQPLSHLFYAHAAAPDFTAVAMSARAVALDILPQSAVDRKAAILATPALIKAYLRLGGVVGQGAFVDSAFNTTDVMMILETAKMAPNALQIIKMAVQT